MPTGSTVKTIWAWATKRSRLNSRCSIPRSGRSVVCDIDISSSVEQSSLFFFDGHAGHVALDSQQIDVTDSVCVETRSLPGSGALSSAVQGHARTNQNCPYAHPIALTRS